MSRLNPTISQNPTERYFKWNGEKGEVQWYNKEAEKNITEELPFTFMLLDELAKITGWHDASESAIWSNEVHNISEEPMKVKTYEGDEITEGLYTDDAVKNAVKANGGRFTASLYIAYNYDDELHIGNLELKGAALSSWLAFRKEAGMKIYSGGIQIFKYVEDTKGKITYRFPKFRAQEVSEEADEKAKDLTRIVTDYFDSKKPITEEAPSASQGDKQEYPDDQPKPNQGENDMPNIPDNLDDIDDDLPF